DWAFGGVYFVVSEATMQVYSWTDPEWTGLAWVAMIAVWIAFSVSAGCCLAAAIYHLIRNEQEGPAPEALAQVFE
ncbi:MAG: hypothetical protein HC858_11605, partial [Brachymonas sp.]|nr:hypothetical protein [Brachymonas sp.]